ncbi:MAG: HNH endonuclease [Gammaproteobacteria bacterium]|nr:HNH endonuclease [Gammaproteobacteria bacterium]
MNDLSLQVLRTDASGMPLEWIDYRDAVRLYHMGLVAYTCGSTLYRVHGGISSLTGAQSIVEVNSILATYGHSSCRRGTNNYTPPLNNDTLFRRDAHLCMYCGEHFAPHDLSRDHITPSSKGGPDSWNNVVTACKRCNHRKGNLSPEQANMPLLAVPFTPTHAEYVYLQGRRILADQMEFLKAHFPRRSPLHERVSM